MKVKVLDCADTGRAVVTRHLELTPYTEGIYFRLESQDQSDPSDWDLLDVFMEYMGIVFYVNSFSRKYLQNENNKEALTAYRDHWVENVLLRAQQDGFIRNLDIKVFELLGLDASPLMRARENWFEKKRIKDMEDEKESECIRKAREQEEKRREEERLNAVRKEFLDGKFIDAKDFIALTKRDGFPLHIRTIGTINKRVEELNKIGQIYYKRIRGKSKPDLTGCIRAIRDYVNFLTQNPTATGHDCKN